MTSLLLALLLTAAGATSAATGTADCVATNDARASAQASSRSIGTCADRDASSSWAPVTDTAPAGSDAASVGGDSTRKSTDDDPWTYETGPDDLEHVCITRGAGGICLDNDE